MFSPPRKAAATPLVTRLISGSPSPSRIQSWPRVKTSPSPFSAAASLSSKPRQAATLLKRNREIGDVWAQISRIVEAHSLPERGETALVNAAFGFRVRNQRYRADHGISDVVASRDLKRLCALNLLVPIGERKGRYYVASDLLRELRAELGRGI